MTAEAIKIICLSLFLLLLGIPSLAQNTKGDRPAPTDRETRFKTPKKYPKLKTGGRSRRGGDKPDRSGYGTPSRKARGGERPGRPIAPLVSGSQPRKTQRAWTGDVTGRRIQPRTSTSRAKNVYPQPATTNYSSRNLKRTLKQNENPNVKRVQRMQREKSSRPRVGKPIRPVFHKTRPQQSERAWRGDITGRKVRAGRQTPDQPRTHNNYQRASRGITSGFRKSSGVAPRVSGRARNVTSSRSFYVNNQSQRLSRQHRDRSRMALNMLRRSTGRPHSGKGIRTIIPRSASAAYISRRSINTWAHFRRAKRKSEHAITTDLAGQKLRGRNYETPRPVLSNPTLNYKRRVAAGERPYKGPAAGGHVSRTQNGRAWTGDVAHRAIRGGFRSKKGGPRPGAPLFGRGPGKDARRLGKYQGDIRSGTRGFGAQGETYSGNIRSRRKLEGGGSVTRGWNNKGLPLQGRTPGQGSKGVGYAGNIRVGNKGFNDQGERYTGNIRRNGRRGFNDQGEEYTGNIRRGTRGFNDQGEEYTGNIRWQRPLKGGGSRSGRHWNNNNRPIIVRTPRGKSADIAGYQGNIRGRKTFNDQGEEYSGNIKFQKPDKGGGSVSGSWNNGGRPIARRSYAGQTRITGYSGDLRARRPVQGGGSVSGKLWNNDGRPLPGRDHSDQKRLSRYAGNIKAQRPDKGGGSVSGKLWNNNEKPILVRVPKNDAERNYSGNLKLARNDYRRNPHSASGALEGKKASPSAVKAGESVRGIRRNWDYIKNPSSDDAAQRTREPGRAFGRLADYQGNIRIKKFDLFGKSDLHPDARFVRLNKNNVDEEKDMFTNFKLWWARLFRKSETQPDHLKDKDKDRKPRYDKGESGLWYE